MIEIIGTFVDLYYLKQIYRLLCTLW